MRKSQLDKYMRTLELTKQLAVQQKEAQKTSQKSIIELESKEMQLFMRMRNTVALKEQAFKALEAKSSSLIKSVEPRKAYKVTQRSETVQPQS